MSTRVEEVERRQAASDRMLATPLSLFELPAESAFEEALPASEIVPIEMLGNALSAYYQSGQHLRAIDQALAKFPYDPRLQATQAMVAEADRSISSHLAAMVRSWSGAEPGAACAIRDGEALYRIAPSGEARQVAKGDPSEAIVVVDLQALEADLVTRIYEAVITSTELRADFHQLLRDQFYLFFDWRRGGSSLAYFAFVHATGQHIRAKMQAERRSASASGTARRLEVV